MVRLLVYVATCRITMYEISFRRGSSAILFVKKFKLADHADRTGLQGIFEFHFLNCDQRITNATVSSLPTKNYRKGTRALSAER